MAINIIDKLTPDARAVPAASAVSDAGIERVAVEGPATSATSDEPAGFRERVRAERAAFEARRGTPAATPLSVQVVPEPKAAPAPVQAAPAPVAAPVRAPTPEAAEAVQEPSEPVVAFPALIPPPVLLDIGEKPVQGRDEDWREFNERQLRYQARVTANEAKLAEANAAVERRNAEVRQIQGRELQRVALAWSDRKAAAIERHPDYLAVTEAADLPFTETMANHVIDLNNGTDVAYHLGKHPDEALRIANLPVPRQIDAIARLSERLSAKSEPATKTATAPRTAPAPKAPAPQRPAAPARVAAADLNAMSMSDYASYRQEQLRAERRH